MEWTVGLVTAPREGSYYLDTTLRSLTEGGWHNVTVFAEPESPIPYSFTGPVVKRPKWYGDWSNWAAGLYELLLSNPASDMFAMFEDDAIICKTALPYIERMLPDLGEFASLSLYTPTQYEKKYWGFHNECAGWFSRSTVTVIMRREMVVDFFSNKDVQNHRFRTLDDPTIPAQGYGIGKVPVISTVGNTAKDAIIGTWAAFRNLPIFYHSPSLAQHIGVNSLINTEKACEANGGLAHDFVGEEFDLFSIPKDQIQIRNCKQSFM